MGIVLNIVTRMHLLAATPTLLAPSTHLTRKNLIINYLTKICIVSISLYKEPHNILYYSLRGNIKDDHSSITLHTIKSGEIFEPIAASFG